MKNYQTLPSRGEDGHILCSTAILDPKGFIFGKNLVSWINHFAGAFFFAAFLIVEWLGNE